MHWNNKDKHIEKEKWIKLSGQRNEKTDGMGGKWQQKKRDSLWYFVIVFVCVNVSSFRWNWKFSIFLWKTSSNQNQYVNIHTDRLSVLYILIYTRARRVCEDSLSSSLFVCVCLFQIGIIFICYHFFPISFLCWYAQQNYWMQW